MLYSSNFTSNTPIMDTQDKPITLANPCAARAVIAAVDDAMGFKLEIHDIGGTIHLVHGIRFNQKPLTIPERAIVAAFAAHFEKYTIGLERGTAVSLPKAVSSPKFYQNEMECMGFQSEARAYMFAGVIERAFDLTAEVIEAPIGDLWFVSVSSPDGIDGGVFERLRGVCQVAMQYRFEWAGNARDDAQDAVPHQDAPSRNESAQRAILARLDAIMERLPVVAEAKPRGRGIEALIPTGKTGKKDSKKTA